MQKKLLSFLQVEAKCEDRKIFNEKECLHMIKVSCLFVDLTWFRIEDKQFFGKPFHIFSYQCWGRGRGSSRSSHNWMWNVGPNISTSMIKPCHWTHNALFASLISNLFEGDSKWLPKKKKNRTEQNGAEQRIMLVDLIRKRGKSECNWKSKRYSNLPWVECE